MLVGGYHQGPQQDDLTRDEHMGREEGIRVSL